MKHASIALLLLVVATKTTAFLPSSTPSPAARIGVATAAGLKSGPLYATQQLGQHEPSQQQRQTNKNESWWERIKKGGRRLTFQDEATRQAEQRRRQHRQQLQQLQRQTQQAFRGVPFFPFGMAGRFVASNVAKKIRREGRKLDKVLNRAQKLIGNDANAVALLGAPVVVGNEFSQSTSTCIVNGKKTKRIRASFEVRGSRRNGTGSVIADERRNVLALELSVGGRSIAIDTTA